MRTSPTTNDRLQANTPLRGFARSFMGRAFAWIGEGREPVASWISIAVICLLGVWLFYTVARGVVTAVSENWIGSAMILAGSLVGAFAFPAFQKLYTLARRLVNKDSDDGANQLTSAKPPYPISRQH